MANDKIKVSVIIDKQALIDKAFKAADTPEEFKEVRLIVEDSDEFVRDVAQVEDEKQRNASNEFFVALALDILLCKYSQTKMAVRIEAENTKEKEEKAKAKKSFEELKKKLGEDNPLISTLGEIFNSEED